MSSVTLTLLGRENCHLCEQAEPLVDEVVAQFANVSVTKASVADRADWLELYSDKIPVVLIEENAHSQWHVDPLSLTEALRSAGGLLSRDKPE